MWSRWVAGAQLHAAANSRRDSYRYRSVDQASALTIRNISAPGDHRRDPYSTGSQLNAKKIILSAEIGSR